MTEHPVRVDRSVFWPLGGLRIVVEPAPEPVMTAEQRARWEALCRLNPALFDGPIYLVAGAALPGGSAGQKPGATLRCRRSRYHEILLRRPGDQGLLLSVTALLTCAGRVLLGHRSAKLRSYPGMWEIGPAGGLDPAGGQSSDETDVSPAMKTAARSAGRKPDAAELGLPEIHAALRAEVREEVGLDIDPRSAQLIGACADEAAHSLDLVMALELAGPLPPLRHGEGWEYQDAGWAPIDQLPQIVRQRRFIAPSLAIMTALGWIDQPPPPPPPAGAGSG